jgi:hypothetical protein
MENKGDNKAIGKTKTAILVKETGKSIAIITEIFAQAVAANSEKRIMFHGPANLENKAISHLETVILPIVDNISRSLGLPPRSFVISISNVGASATKGVGLNIAGFSADVPLFLSMLSASMQASLRRDLIATGHIASLAGDIVPVLGIPAKVEAAIASGDISEFLFPDIENDLSATRLMPRADFIEAKKAFYDHKGQIKLTAIEDIHDALKSFFTEEAIVMSALVQGFFDTKPDIKGDDNPLSRSIVFLLADNERRFWETTKDHLFRHEAEKAKAVIQFFIDYHLERKRYPRNFGEQLHRLAMSLPPLVRRLDGLFPLLPVDQCIALSHYAAQTDHVDVQLLYKLTAPDEFTKMVDATSSEIKDPTSGDDREGELLRKILFELSNANLTRKIGLSLDEARACYPMRAVTVKDASEFNQAITSFYIHLMRHTQSPEGHVSWEAATSEAIDRVEDSFRRGGGYNTALAEAKTGTKGGLRHVFDVMIESEKSVKIGKYMTMVLKEAIDSLDWEAKVKLSVYIKNQYGRYMPDSFRIMEPEQLAHRLEESIRLLTEGEKDIDRWLRKQ